MSDIKILDVIVTKQEQRFVIVDRRPDYIYEKNGNSLIAHDSGFYVFRQIVPGSKGAFAGRKFDLRLTDGSILHCEGQVWDGGFNPPEPVIDVGVATIDELRSCYVFTGAHLSKPKWDAWLSENKPSKDYYKHDPRGTIEWMDSLYAKEQWDKPVCAKRARKLKQKGVTIRIDKITGKRGWSPTYEKRKAEILARQAVDKEPS